jgi:hypothetical protein
MIFKDSVGATVKEIYLFDKKEEIYLKIPVVDITIHRNSISLWWFNKKNYLFYFC